MKERWPIIAFTVLLSLSVGWLIVGDILDRLSKEVDLQAVAEGKAIYGPREFWIWRYQSMLSGLLAAGAALAAAWVAWASVQSQMARYREEDERRLRERRDVQAGAARRQIERLKRCVEEVQELERLQRIGLRGGSIIVVFDLLKQQGKSQLTRLYWDGGGPLFDYDRDVDRLENVIFVQPPTEDARAARQTQAVIAFAKLQEHKETMRLVAQRLAAEHHIELPDTLGERVA